MCNKQTLDDAQLSSWKEFKRYKLTPFMNKLAKGEKGFFPKTIVTLNTPQPPLSFSKLLEMECDAEGVRLMELDCRQVSSYDEALLFIHQLSENITSGVVHFSHLTEMPVFPYSEQAGNLLVNSWKNKVVSVKDVTLDTDKYLVFFSYEQGVGGNNPVNYLSQLAVYPKPIL